MKKAVKLSLALAMGIVLSAPVMAGSRHDMMGKGEMMSKGDHHVHAHRCPIYAKGHHFVLSGR